MFCIMTRCVGSSFCFMYAYHVGCMSVDFGVRSLGSLRCSVSAGRRRTVRRLSMALRSCGFELSLSSWGSLASMASVGWAW